MENILKEFKKSEEALENINDWLEKTGYQGLKNYEAETLEHWKEILLKIKKD